MKTWLVVIAAAFVITAVDAFQLSTTHLCTQSRFKLARRSPALRAPSPGSVRCSVPSATELLLLSRPCVSHRPTGNHADCTSLHATVIGWF